MKKVLIGTSEGGETLVVEWENRVITITFPDGEREEYGGYDITYGSIDEGEIFWQGKNFHITKIVHEYFTVEYPCLNLKSYYMDADEWCAKKNKKIKRPQQFMNNWLAKTRKGKAERGGVIY